MISPILSQDQIHRVHAAATVLGVTLDDLVCELSPAIRLALPSAGSPSVRLLAGLDDLNRMVLQDGSLPIRSVLTTARAVAGPRAEAVVFQDALNHINEHYPDCASQRLDLASQGTIPAFLTALRHARGRPLLALLLLFIIASALFLVSQRPHATIDQEQAQGPRCPTGRQLYEGACVADKMVDLVVCLKANKALTALKLAQEAILAQGVNLDGAKDEDIRATLGNSFLALAQEEAAALRTFCQRAADAANVEIPRSPTDDRRDARLPPKGASTAITTQVALSPDPNCSFSVDGNPIPRSSFITFAQMIPGKHRVTCRWADGVEQTQSIQVEPPDSFRRHWFRFRREGTGTMLIRAPAPGCNFKIDGSFVTEGTSASLSLPSGTYLVACKRIGDTTGRHLLTPLSQFADIFPSRTTTVNFE